MLGTGLAMAHFQQSKLEETEIDGEVGCMEARPSQTVSVKQRCSCFAQPKQAKKYPTREVGQNGPENRRACLRC